jgi:iron complex transport system substrate-binding protein
MNKSMIAGLFLVIIIASSLAVGYSQNWFQSSQAEPTPIPTAQPTDSPTAEPTSTATSTPKPATTKPTIKPTTKPTATRQPTTVDELDLSLEIYGNANMDDKIDSQDVTYLQNIISGSTTTTTFADANLDGAINAMDVDQVNAIIAGTASQLKLLDGNRKNITLTLPEDRIIVEYIQNAELIRILELQDKVVGVDYCVDQLNSIYFPENGVNIASVGNMYTPDYEAVLNLNPDIILTFNNVTADKVSKLPGVDVLYLGLYYPNVTYPEDSEYVQAILKAGYIFNRVDQATEYANWLLDLTSTLWTNTNSIITQKTVFIANYPYTTSAALKAYATVDTLGQACILSGGSNIAQFANATAYLTTASVTIDAEWLLSEDPDYIILHTVRYTYSGVTNADPAQGLDITNTTSIVSCLQQYISQAKFANLTAVQNNRVYIISGDGRNNAMGGALAAVIMQAIMYPSQATLNPQTVYQEYITNFLHLNYNLETQGVFIYPALTMNSDTVGIPDV